MAADDGTPAGDADFTTDLGGYHAISPLGADPEEEPKRKKRGFLWFILAAVLIVAALVVGVINYWPGVGGNTGAVMKDMHGNTVVPDDPEVTNPAWIASASAVASDTPGGLNIDSVKLHVPLGSVNAVNNVMNPPGFASAYWVRNMGVSLANADQGTVYIVAHSLRNGGMAPGNYVIDVANKTTSLKPGDIIQAGSRTYKFTSYQIIPKTELGSHADLWTNQPGRLVFITCMLEQDHTLSLNNMVIIATLVS